MTAGRTMIVAVLSGFALLTAACGNTPQNPGTSQPPATTQPPAGSMSAGQGNADPAKIEFANGICTAVQKFIGPATAFKPDTSSPAAALNSLKTQLGTMSAGLDSAAGDLGNVKSDGVPDGKTAVTELQKTFGQLKQTVDTAKTKLDGIDPNNPQAISTGVQDVSKDLASLGNMQNPLDQPALKAADMEAAAERAPECQKIQTQMSARAGSSSMTPSTPASR